MWGKRPKSGSVRIRASESVSVTDEKWKHTEIGVYPWRDAGSLASVSGLHELAKAIHDRRMQAALSIWSAYLLFSTYDGYNYITYIVLAIEAAAAERI